MCVDIWKRPPCGHSIFQNTFKCEQLGNEGHGGGTETAFGVPCPDISAVAVGIQSSSSSVYDEGSCCSNFEDELYHCKPSAAELRRRRLSSLSSFLLGLSSPTSPSTASGRVRSSLSSQQCRVTKAIRPVHERECPECALEREEAHQRQRQWYQPRRSGAVRDDHHDFDSWHGGSTSRGISTPGTRQTLTGRGEQIFPSRGRADLGHLFHGRTSQNLSRIRFFC